MMLRAAVVPKHHIALRPFVAIDEGVGHAMGVERVEKRGALRFVHIDHVFQNLAAEIECFPPGLGMRADDWMDHFLLGIFLYLPIHRLAEIFLPQRHLAIAGPLGSLPGMHGFHAGQQILHGIRERFVGAVHVDENCVVARFGYIQGV